MTAERGSLEVMGFVGVEISGVIWLVISASIRRRIHPALVDSGDSGYLTFLPPFPSSGVPT